MSGHDHAPVLVAGGLPGRLPEESDPTGFWETLVAELAADPLQAEWALLLSDRPAPRTWLILHRPGKPETSALCAAALAAACAARQQATVILDVDEDESLLTRLSGLAEQEGWLDMARYGVSLSAAGRDAPWAGRSGRFLGVGSYTPTEVTDEERRRLLGRLRHQADDLILVGVVDGTGTRWAPFAEQRIFCWDRATDGPEVPNLAGGVLQRTGHPLTAVLAMGTAPEPAAVSAPAPAAGPAAPRQPAPATAGPDAVQADAPAPAAHARRRRGSSWVFRLAALAVVALISVLGMYYWRYLRPGTGAEVRSPAPATSLADLARRQADGDGQDRAGEENAPAASQGPDLYHAALDTTGTGRVPADADSLVGEIHAAADPAADAGGSGPAGDNVQAGEMQAEEIPAEEIQAGEKTAAETRADDVPGDEDRQSAEPAPDETLPAGPYTGPVGAGGWALHVFSLADSTSALVEAGRMQERGIAALIVPHRAADGKLWYRVLAGSFATRGEADAAVAALKETLGADYAAPVRHRSSAPE